MANRDNQPFEAGYEAAKQSIISYLGEISQVYELPIPLINILIYEIALESRNASFSAIVGGCDISYPQNPNSPKTNTAPDLPASNVRQAPEAKPKTVTMKKDDALKELKKMGVNVTETDKPDKTSTEKSA